MTDSTNQFVRIDYTNHRGSRYWRRILPIRIYFGATEWYREPQWLLEALDLEKGEKRTFAMLRVHCWRAEARDEGEL